MSRMDTDDLCRICRERHERYRKCKRLNAPDVLCDWYRSRWHDAEYALSLKQGYYDPASDKNKFVVKALAEKGYEITPSELIGIHRRAIMEKLMEVAIKHDLAPEYGHIVRIMIVARNEALK